MNQLQVFYNNENQREAVKLFMIDVLKEIAVERSFDGKSVEGIPEARELINTMFNKLSETYGKMEEPIINNSR